MVAVALTVTSCGAFSQVESGGTREVTSCNASHESGGYIVSKFDIVRFHVPRFAKVKKVADIDYVEYYVRYGPDRDKRWLHLMFGTLVGGDKPQDAENSSIKWVVSRWGCERADGGTDWKGAGPGDRRWRHVSFPFAFASYSDARPKAADYFDRMLDSMCCVKAAK